MTPRPGISRVPSARSGADDRSSLTSPADTHSAPVASRGATLFVMPVGLALQVGLALAPSFPLVAGGRLRADESCPGRPLTFAGRDQLALHHVNARRIRPWTFDVDEET